jgi:uncharacterized protein YndB with AHSA1/START domain
MKWALIIVGSLFSLLALIALIGAMQPRDHVATMTATIAAPADKVWAVLTDVAAYPTWRTGLKSVDVLSKPDAPLSWRENTRQGPMTLTVESFEPPRRMVARIMDDGQPFGGAWEYVVAPDNTDAGKARVTITERGWVSNPIFRFVSRFVMGHYSTLDTYLRALSRKFGAEVTPARLSS